MSRGSRATLLTILISLLIAATPPLARGQESTELATEIGSGPLLDQAWSFRAQSRSSDDQITIAGSLDDVFGLDPAILAASSTPAAAPSSFTFLAEIGISDRSANEETTTMSGSGTLVVFRHEETQPTWDDFASFASDLAIAEYAVALRETAQQQSSRLGVVAGDMRLTQTTARTFTLDGERYRFGHAGAELTARYVGGLTSTASEATDASVFGAAKVTRREIRPAEIAETEISTPVTGDCAALIPWAAETRSRLQQAGELRATVPPDARFEEADLDALAAAAATVAALAADQRADPPPDAGSDAARLAITALSTDARGLNLLISAITAEDVQTRADAEAILADGAALTNRALSALDEIELECESAS